MSHATTLIIAPSATYPLWLLAICALLVSTWGAFLAVKPDYIVSVLARSSSRSELEQWWIRWAGLLDPRFVRLWGVFLILIALAGVVVPIVAQR